MTKAKRSPEREAELKARREAKRDAEIEAAVERLLDRDEANGLPRTVSDPKVLAELARIISGP